MLDSVEAMADAAGDNESTQQTMPESACVGAQQLFSQALALRVRPAEGDVIRHGAKVAPG